MTLIFLHAGKLENLPQIDTMILMGTVNHSQSSQNSKFTMFLQYLKSEVSDEVNFLHADKYKSLLQIHTMMLIGIVKHSQSFQNSKFLMSLLYLKKEVRD